MPSPSEYTVGWICAVATEMVAAIAFLDEEHDDPESTFRNDNNAYSLGRLGNHNVVIAGLPDGEYGISAAGSVATDMLRSYPNIRIGLVVGIAGGAPNSKNDVRLGDVVVSAPRNRESGVFHYDFGKTIQAQTFQETMFLDQPPRLLRAAVSKLITSHAMRGNSIHEDIEETLNRWPRLRRQYQRPDLSTDRLYLSHVLHPQVGGVACDESCGSDSNSCVVRKIRKDRDDDPVIHYGLIASGSQLMKDATIRDRLSGEKNVLCFEMEAAGVMNHFPCLVIRGICDYSDTHKNDNWQGYAAMAAAAYAKDLLSRIPPSMVKEEEKLSDLLSKQLGLQEKAHDVQKAQHDIAQEQLELQKEAIRQKDCNEEKECLRVFRLTDASKDATYEWYKDRVDDRVDGTCEWFLGHDNFQLWLAQESGPLIVSADPGCGKSVLAKYLIDVVLRESATVCYFFFKQGDQTLVQQALCALLHQLCTQKPFLIKHAMEAFRKDGEMLVRSTECLWNILESALGDPDAGPIIFILDALDECDDLEFENLARRIDSQFSSKLARFNRVRYLLTCRPYRSVLSKFQGLDKYAPAVRIPGEEESEAISREVNHVIAHRVQNLPGDIPQHIRAHLQQKLQEMSHRTYLWVYLVFDQLEKEGFMMTLSGVEDTLATLPKTVDEAYEKILFKSKEHPMVLKTLSIILAAHRPLTLSEMNIAVHIDKTWTPNRSLEGDEHFAARLRSWCGLLVSIHHGKVYFLHQTVREFLVAIPSSESGSPQHWCRPIRMFDAHTVLAEACLLYLTLFNSVIVLDTETEIDNFANSHTFLQYSATAWAHHFRLAKVSPVSTILSTSLCDMSSKSYRIWTHLFAKDTTRLFFDDNDTTTVYWRNRKLRLKLSSLAVAAIFGFCNMAILLLGKDDGIDDKSNTGKTALSWASSKGHAAMVTLLLDHGAVINARDDESLPQLYAKPQSRMAAILRGKKWAGFGVEKGAEFEVKRKWDRTPLSYLATILLEKGAPIDERDFRAGGPLWHSAYDGHADLVRLLLDRGASMDSTVIKGRTLLSLSAERNHAAVIRLLAKRGAGIEATDGNDRTPLLLAAEGGQMAAVEALLDCGAMIDAKDKQGKTALLLAVSEGHLAMAKLLCEKGAAIEAKDKLGNTPLQIVATNWAKERRIGDSDDDEELYPARHRIKRLEHIDMIELLIKYGADPNRKIFYGSTLLSWASKGGYTALVELLHRYPTVESDAGPRSEEQVSRDSRDYEVGASIPLGADHTHKCPRFADDDV